MLRREAMARRQASAEPEELVLDAPVALKPEALSRRPVRLDEDLFEPVRQVAGVRR
jgi:hypothetical protein